MNIHQCMVAILRDLDAITKDKTAGTGNFSYKFRGIDQIYNAINPLLCKYGVYMTAKVLSKSREERVKADGEKKTVTAFTSLHMLYRFNASDGTFVETEAEGEGMDSGDKSSNKAMSVAHKYAILQAFCVPTEDIVDPDNDTSVAIVPKGASAAQPQPKVAPAPALQEATTERKQSAANWCFEAKEHVQSIANGAALETWVTRNARAMDAALPLAPNAHKQLCDAIEQHRSKLQPLAAE